MEGEIHQSSSMRKTPFKIILECYIFKGAGLRRVSVCSFNWVSPGQKRTQFRTFRKHNQKNKQSVEPGHIDRVLRWWNSINMSFILSLTYVLQKHIYILYIYPIKVSCSNKIWQEWWNMPAYKHKKVFNKVKV